MFLICLVVFTLELIISFVVQDGYKFSLFFWFDILSIVSIIPDIDWMVDDIQELFGMKRYDKSVDVIPGVDINDSNSTEYAIRILNGFRISRLMRVIKLYKYCLKKKKNQPEKEGYLAVVKY